MRDDRGRQIGEGTQLLHLAGARNREQASDGEFALSAAIPEHNLPPLDGRPQCTLRSVVGRLDAVLTNKDKELLMVREEPGRQIPAVLLRSAHMPVGKRKELPLQWQDLVDQLRPRERRAACVRIAPVAIPEAEQPRMERQGVAAKAIGVAWLRQVEC